MIRGWRFVVVVVGRKPMQICDVLLHMDYQLADQLLTYVNSSPSTFLLDSVLH